MTEREKFMKLIQIPSKIKWLMESGLWEAEENCELSEILRIDYNWSDKIKLYSNLDKKEGGLLITSETEEIGNIYGTYRTGDKNDEEALDWIDANKAIMISVNYDEESICLDYRFSKVNPRIVATYFASLPKRYGRWKEIAKNEDELITKLGIEM